MIGLDDLYVAADHTGLFLWSRRLGREVIVAEAEVFGKLREIASGATSLVIAHRFSTVRIADKIVVIEDGRLAEEGTHGELMEYDGIYVPVQPPGGRLPGRGRPGRHRRRGGAGPGGGAAVTLSVMFPVMPERIEDLVRFARRVADGPCHRLWMGQTLTYETFQALAYLAGAGVRLPVGTGVALTPLRHPYEAALQARTVAQLMGHPVVAAFGTGGQEFAQDMLGAPHARPATAVAESCCAPAWPARRARPPTWR